MLTSVRLHPFWASVCVPDGWSPQGPRLVGMGGWGGRVRLVFLCWAGPGLEDSLGPRGTEKGLAGMTQKCQGGSPGWGPAPSVDRRAQRRPSPWTARGAGRLQQDRALPHPNCASPRAWAARPRSRPVAWTSQAKGVSGPGRAGWESSPCPACASSQVASPEPFCCPARSSRAAEGCWGRKHRHPPPSPILSQPISNSICAAPEGWC